MRDKIMPKEGLKRKLTAILSADVEGYSRLMGNNEALTIHTLTEYKEAMTANVKHNRGRVVDAPGDNLLAEFGSVVDAVQCAVEIQRELAERNEELPNERKMVFRIGVNLGDVVEEKDRIYGDGVNIAARIESICDGGGVCISGTAFEHVENKLDLEYEDLGDHKVKNIEKPVRVYRVLSYPGAAAHRVIRAKKTVAKKWSKMLVAVVAALVVVGAVALWHFYFRPPMEVLSVEKTAFPLPEKPSIAVLPFDNLSGELEQEYFSDGITDDLITDLSKISGLFVIARNSAFAYKGKPVKIRQIAEELGVRYVLEGSVRKADNRVRINAQLIDATTGGHLWAERYDRHYTDIFELQDEVIGKIVSALTVKLTGVEQAQLARRPTDNLEAYDYYLRAERDVYSEDYSLLSVTLSLYEKAIALDPNFADAHAGYARAAVDVWRLGYDNVLASPVARKRAYEAADRALALDAKIPRAYSVLGVLQVVDGRHDEAIESARKAVSLVPNSADAYVNLAIVFMFSGRPAEALAAVETALRLNPRPSSGVYGYYGAVLFMNRQYEKAIEPLEKARESSYFAREYLAMAYAQLGRLDDAKAEIAGLLPDTNLSWYRVSYAHYKREEDRAHLLDALRKAGVPEWPFGYEGRTEDRLDGSAIKTLALGRTWVGHNPAGIQFIQEIGEDGKFAYRSVQSFVTGQASVQGDMLCLKSAAYLMGRKRCGYVYRNPGGTIEENNEYVYVGITALLFFSPVR
jgi:TolB-like protein/class 3 adenylate cyclase/cytochrome c-type biogenesis protein CcmH/NrfG